MTFRFGLEDPVQPEIVALLDEGERYGAALYPAESNHFLSIESLRAPNIRFVVARDAAGLRMEYVEYFGMRGRIEGRCGLPRPDIIFDMGGGNTQVVSENGHFIVARHFGAITDERGTGGEVLATGFVAIPDELYATLAAADSARAATRAR